jgi:RNA polymerase sigma-70 factor (ECF subfamily)
LFLMAAFESERADSGNARAHDGTEVPALLIGRLYEQHFRMVRALCQLLLRNSADAEDAAQQTFLSAFGSLIDGTVPSRPAPWLATIARRECWARTAQRRGQPLALDETNAPISSTHNPLDEAIRNIDLTAIWLAINDLPRQQRHAFLMREFSGLSYAEVADALGASESAIESLLVRARRQLRDGLEPVIRSANLIATPLIVLQHRLGRLFGGRTAAGAAASVGIPVAAKLGAAVAGVVLLGSAGVAIGTAAGQHQRAAPGAPLDLAAQTPVTNTFTPTNAFVRLLGKAAANRMFPVTQGWDAFGSPSYATDSSVTDTTAVLAGAPTSEINPADATPTDAVPIDGAAPGGTVTDPAPQDPAADPTAPSDTTPADNPPVATDTAPVDTTPVTDPTPADTAPTLTDPSATPPTDTTPGP